MEIRLRPADYAQQAAHRFWGDTSRPEVVADLVRAEVTARGSSTRWAIARRVARGASIELATVEEICRQLEAEGDVSAARGGVLHVTPVRLISCGTAEYRIISSLPTRNLQAKLSSTIDARGVRRTLHASHDGDALGLSVAKVGGIILTPEQWAGLALAPAADEAWLRALDTRLTWLPEAAWSLERDGALDWQGLTLTDGDLRYRRGAEGARLWRARSPFGRWLYAWGSPGASPAAGEFVSLTWDDANRTTFAVARGGNTPVAAALTRDESDAVLKLDAWLPRSEFRYLSTIATPTGERGAWLIPAPRVDDIVTTLEDRLGLDIKAEVRG